jgi:long-chain acyl-CoA synthetase
MRGAANQAGPAIENANARLAEFQRVRRWVLWPEPDLPRTSTGKVRRKAVASWLAENQSTRNGSREAQPASAPSDWLLSLIAQITGETPSGIGDDLRLAEDLHLDSLGRVQLAAAIEEKLGMPPESGFLEQVQTLGQLRHLVASGYDTKIHAELAPQVTGHDFSRAETASEKGPALAPHDSHTDATASPVHSPLPAIPAPGARNYIYPHWPWRAPIRWIRSAFIELIMRPLVRFLARPRLIAPPDFAARVQEPILIIANHVTTYDAPLIQYALPGRLRRHIAAAMSGEMLDDFRHFRSPEHPGRISPFGPIAWFLVTALFNVFPLARLRDFQRSFAHAGEALDRGYHVLVFPEGTRSEAGKLARFRPGIGLLVKQSDTAVLPIAIRGLGELKARGRGWFRSGTIEVRVGEPLRFAPDATETAITERLHDAVDKLLGEKGTGNRE